jgi:hypothetical protein
MDRVYLKSEILVKVRISFFLKCLAICDGQTDCACSHVLLKCTETLLMILYEKKKKIFFKGKEEGGVGWGFVRNRRFMNTTVVPWQILKHVDRIIN